MSYVAAVVGAIVCAAFAVTRTVDRRRDVVRSHGRQRERGSLGFDPVMTFASEDDAPDNVLIGPAVSGVWQYSKTLNLGLFNQNVFGNDTRISQIRTVVAYQLGDGWPLSPGDLQFVHDWEHSPWLSVPVGLQVGKVTRFGDRPVRVALAPQYNLSDHDGLPKWNVQLTFTVLAPGT